MPGSNLGSEGKSEIDARLRCFDRYPIPGHKYFLLLGCINGEISYYSKGVAWPDDQEVRVARLVNAVDAAQYYKNKGVSLAIINSKEDFYIWMQHWCCHALIDKATWLALDFSD